MIRFAIALLVTSFGIAAAAAQELNSGNLIDEVRGGIGAHAVYTGTLIPTGGDWDFSNVSDLTFDVLFSSPNMDAFRWLGGPRPEIGATINFSGEESLVYANLVWQLGLFDTPLYLEGAFGAAIHDGYLNDAPPGERNLGCRVNFYERFGLGANLTENVTATLTYEHMSNAELCENNDGFSNVGLRIGWKF